MVPGWYETELRERLLDECVESVRNLCLNKREYLTICKLDAGGSKADIDVAILTALMKGMLIMGWPIITTAFIYIRLLCLAVPKICNWIFKQYSVTARNCKSLKIKNTNTDTPYNKI